MEASPSAEAAAASTASASLASPASPERAESAESPAGTVVLVTGGGGFIASHLILRLLADGYAVRTTVRDLAREPDMRKSLATAGAAHLEQLSLYAADLMADAGWAEAVQGCTYVHHVASPFPAKDPRSADELVRPAREGALRVLRASQAAGVRRVVLTSSFAAIGYGHEPGRSEPYTEDDWSVVGPSLPAYHKSKTLAEKAAWAFVEEAQGHGSPLELAVVNPTGTFGPVLAGGHMATSLMVVKRMLDGTMPVMARLYFGVVDVRDVADLHVRAMLSPAAAGQRFIAVADTCPESVPDIAQILRRERPALAAHKVPTLIVPNCLVRLAGHFHPAARNMVTLLDDVRVSSNQKAKTVLGWQPRPLQDTIVDTADSMAAAGLL